MPTDNEGTGVIKIGRLEEEVRMETIKEQVPVAWQNKDGECSARKDLEMGYSIPLFTSKQISEAFQYGLRSVDANNYVPLSQVFAWKAELDECYITITQLRQQIALLEYTQAKWVDVQESMPEFRETVAVLCNDISYAVNWREKKRWGKQMDDDITHWLRLPPVPQVLKDNIEIANAIGLLTPDELKAARAKAGY